jgi:DNA-directed RNA polymerase beta subunit
MQFKTLNKTKTGRKRLPAWAKLSIGGTENYIGPKRPAHRKIAENNIVHNYLGSRTLSKMTREAALAFAHVHPYYFWVGKKGQEGAPFLPFAPRRGATSAYNIGMGKGITWASAKSFMGGEVEPLRNPDFVDIQRKSFFGLLEKGLIEEFSKRNPITNTKKTMELFFYPEYYQLTEPAYTASQAIIKSKSYTSRLYIPVQLTVRYTRAPINMGGSFRFAGGAGSVSGPLHSEMERLSARAGVAPSVTSLSFSDTKNSTREGSASALGSPHNTMVAHALAKQGQPKGGLVRGQPKGGHGHGYNIGPQLNMGAPGASDVPIRMNAGPYLYGTGATSEGGTGPSKAGRTSASAILLKWVYVGNIPLMTKRGHFILNGCARVIVNQMIRSPGIYYQKKNYENFADKWSEKPETKFERYYADLICNRGTWLRIEIDKYNKIWAQMKRVPKIPIMWFLIAMGLTEKIILKRVLDSKMLLYNLQEDPLNPLRKILPYVKTPPEAWSKIYTLVAPKKRKKTTRKSTKPVGSPSPGVTPKSMSALVALAPRRGASRGVKGKKGASPLDRVQPNGLRGHPQKMMPLPPSVALAKQGHGQGHGKKAAQQQGARKGNFAWKETNSPYKYEALKLNLGSREAAISSGSDGQGTPNIFMPLNAKPQSRAAKHKGTDKGEPINIGRVLTPQNLDGGTGMPSRVKSESDSAGRASPYNSGGGGNQSLSELGRKWIFNKFMNPRTYDLGKVGRLNFNKKFNLAISLNQTTLTPQDLLLATDYLILVSKGLRELDDIDHLKNRRVRTAGELIQLQIGIGLVRLEKSVREKMNKIDISKITVKNRSEKLLNGPGSPPEGGQPNIRRNSAPKTKTTQKGLYATNDVGTKMSKIDSGGNTPDKYPPVQKVNVGAQYNLGQALTGISAAHTANGRFVSRQLSTERSAAPQLTISNIVNTKAFNGALKEFFGSSPLSQFMDQINPLAELTHKRRLSSMGPGGVTRDSATLEIRGIHPSHYGRICPVETPEGKNTGLVNSLTAYARVNHKGYIETPFYRVYKGQVQKKTGLFFFSAKQEEKIRLGAADLNTSDIGFLPLASIPVRIAEDFTKISRNAIQYVGVAPIQMISIATSLIPFFEHDDGNRALMGSNMQRQAVPILKPQRPIVGTGLEARAVSDSGHVLQAKYSGLVTYVSSDKITVLVQTARNIIPHAPPSVALEVLTPPSGGG